MKSIHVSNMGPKILKGIIIQSCMSYTRMHSEAEIHAKQSEISSNVSSTSALKHIRIWQVMQLPVAASQ